MSVDMWDDEDTCLIQEQEKPEYVKNLISAFNSLDINPFEKGVICKLFKSTEEWTAAFMNQEDILDLGEWVRKISSENK